MKINHFIGQTRTQSKSNQNTHTMDIVLTYATLNSCFNCCHTTIFKLNFRDELYFYNNKKPYCSRTLYNTEGPGVKYCMIHI